MKVKVSQDKCIGCGNCVNLTNEEVFCFDDDGFAECITDLVPEDMEETVKDAIIQCPTDAISEVNVEEE